MQWPALLRCQHLSRAPVLPREQPTRPRPYRYDSADSALIGIRRSRLRLTRWRCWKSLRQRSSARPFAPGRSSPPGQSADKVFGYSGQAVVRVQQRRPGPTGVLHGSRPCGYMTAWRDNPISGRSRPCRRRCACLGSDSSHSSARPPSTSPSSASSLRSACRNR
jgi:hypothetical protein